MKKSQQNRLLELLADKTLFGLSEEESLELKALQNEFPDWEEDTSLELTAAMIDLSYLEVNDPMPQGLRARVSANAEKFFNEKEKSPKVLNFTPKTTGQTLDSTAAESAVGIMRPEPKPSMWNWLGWTVAAAACVALAINLWLTRFQKPNEVVRVPETIQTPTPELTNAQKREQLLASATDAVQSSFTDPKNEKEILGDMVWSNSLQKGFVRFRGLPPNEVSKETYQLWIVDETQNQKTPLSGGVFDVSSNGEVIVPINAQLQVKKPKILAVTKEKAGGVVVSQPDRIVAVAKI